MLDLSLSKKTQADFLEDDITYLLSLQSNSFDLGSSLNSSSNADIGYVNIPTPFGSIASTVESFADLMMAENDGNGSLTFPTLEQGGSSWGFGDGFGIDPAILEVDGGGLFDFDFDVEMSLDIG